ncbi:MAG TPA: ester cyclase, partial [Chloroflexota bacterium]
RGRPMMAATGNVALVRRLYEAVWNDGDPAVADELIAPREVHHPHGGTEPGGPEAQKQAARRFRRAFPDNRLTIELVVDGGELIAVRWRIEGTHAATGRPITDYTGVNIFRISDGKIVEIWDTRDDLGLYAQVGLIPPRSELAPQLVGSAPQQ